MLKVFLGVFIILTLLGCDNKQLESNLIVADVIGARCDGNNCIAVAVTRLSEGVLRAHELNTCGRDYTPLIGKSALLFSKIEGRYSPTCWTMYEYKSK